MNEPNAMELLRSRMTLRTSTALMQTLTDLISSGALRPGDRLPTVRAVAEECGMSRSAVGEAWSDLSARGLIETRRRGGTRVLGKPAVPRALRYESMIRSTMTGVRDLANIRTDDLPYPSLSRAFEQSLSQPQLNALFELPITDELRVAAQASWPFAPARFLVMHGLMDSVEMLLSTLVQPGDTVIVESPTHGRVLDVLEALGARPLQIDYLEDGPDLVALQRALISKPVAFLYQPTGQAPSGRTVSADWLGSAAEILPPTLPVIELSQLSALHPGNISLGTLLPDQVTHVRSYNVFFGADMRLSIVGGNAELIEAVWMRLTYTTRFVSRILQGALAFLLTDETSQEELRALLTELTTRHELFSEALRVRGFAIEQTQGPCVWIEVPDDHSVCTRLSQHGVAVHPGRFFLRPGSGEERVHVNSAAIDGDHEQVADLIAAACRFMPG